MWKQCCISYWVMWIPHQKFCNSLSLRVISLLYSERSSPKPEVRGGSREELPHIWGQWWRTRGATPWPFQGWGLRGANPCPRSSGCVGTRGLRGATPRSKSGGATSALCWSSGEEIPHVQGKRNPSKTVGVVRGHQRAETLKPYSQKTSQSNHTRTTALSNSMKPSHAVWGHPRWAGHGGEVWQNVIHWRREWQTTSVFLPWEPHGQYEKVKW